MTMATPSPAENTPFSSTLPGNTAPTRHGTYQSIRKLVALGEQPFTEQLKGNVEIKSAAIEYRRKAPAKASQ
jgi:hypothetical protein